MPHCPYHETQLLSTMHKDISISDNAIKTPEKVSCCRETNNRISAVDQIAKKYTVNCNAKAVK